MQNPEINYAQNEIDEKLKMNENLLQKAKIRIKHRLSMQLCKLIGKSIATI